MALDVKGYNATFKAFAEFAQERIDAREKKDVARTGGSGVPPLSAEIAEKPVITSATHDKAYALTRSARDKAANDTVRSLFRNSVAEMFGGEDKIPESVKAAMKLSDYGKGKPLTARRIMAVRQAIDGVAGIVKENLAVRDAMLNEDLDALPNGYSAIIDAAIDDMRAKLGPAIVPENATLYDLASVRRIGGALADEVKAANGEPRKIDPAVFREKVDHILEDTCFRKLVADHAKMLGVDILKGKPLPAGFVSDFLKSHPEFKTGLKEARTLERVGLLLNGIADELVASLKRAVRLAELKSGFRGNVARRLAAKFGITEEEAKERFGFHNRAGEKANKLASSIARGEYPGADSPAFNPEFAFDELADDIVRSYAEKLAIVDSLEGVSAETKAALKATVSDSDRPDKPFADARRARRVASGLAEHATRLRDVLAKPDATDDERFAAIASIADAIDAAIKTEFADEIKKARLETDEALGVVMLVKDFVCGMAPGLAEALDALKAEEAFVDRANQHFLNPEQSLHPMRANIMTTFFF